MTRKVDLAHRGNQWIAVVWDDESKFLVTVYAHSKWKLIEKLLDRERKCRMKSW